MPRIFSLLVLSVLTWNTVNSQSEVFRVKRPWCFDDHLHFNALSEARVFYGYEVGAEFLEEHLNIMINDTFASVSCDQLEVEGVDCCSQALTADNIYQVLDIEPGNAMTWRQFQDASTFLVTWVFQLEHKCEESKTIDWSTVTYDDITRELMHAFHDHHDDGHDDDHDDDHDHDHDDDHDHGHVVENNTEEKVGANHDHGEYFTAVDLEMLFRAIDTDYTPSGIEPEFKEEFCNQSDAWTFRSREIWRDIHLAEEAEGIAADEVGEMSAILVLYMLHGYCFVEDRIADDNLPLEEDFLIALFNTFGKDCTIDEHGFDEIIELLGTEDDGHAHSFANKLVGIQDDHDHDHDSPYSDVTEECLDSHQLQDTFKVDLHQRNLTREDFVNIAPALVQQVVQGCQHHHHSTPDGASDAEKYGYGFLCCLIIALTALLGLVVRKWHHTPAYKYTIVTMLGLASGTLIGDVLLHLIPHAVGLHDHDHHDHGDMDINDLEIEPYVWKMLCSCASIWLFFLLQLGLMEINERHTVRKRAKGFGSQMNGQANMGFEPELKAVSMKEIQVEVASEKCPEKAEPQEDVQTVSEDMDNVAGSVAWLAVAGDAAHKAADGLAIGAAFASDLTLGFSTALAVFCHEVPHEMGDIAIMLSAGWSVPKVAILQLATTLAAFAGLFIGIPLSSNEEARSWIFLIAAGMFLYVALSNVMPEMVRTYKHYRSTAILVAANVGFVLGIMIMFIIAIFEEYISI